MERLNSGDQKNYLRNEFEKSRYWSDEMWKSKKAGGGCNKKRFQYCADPSRQEILYLRTLQGHSRRNTIDPSLQDNVSIPDNFFEYIYHVGCAINLRYITNSALDPMSKEHRNPNKLDLEAPRLAWYKQKKWKKHQNTVYWVDIKFAL